MLKRAVLICPRCKESAEFTIKESESFPNKCDKCGSTNIMVTHLVTRIREPGEVEVERRNRQAIDKAAKQAAEGIAQTLLKV
jgi:phage FluMu protein Com